MWLPLAKSADRQGRSLGGWPSDTAALAALLTQPLFLSSRGQAAGVPDDQAYPQFGGLGHVAAHPNLINDVPSRASTPMAEHAEPERYLPLPQISHAPAPYGLEKDLLELYVFQVVPTSRSALTGPLSGLLAPPSQANWHGTKSSGTTSR